MSGLAASRQKLNRNRAGRDFRRCDRFWVRMFSGIQPAAGDIRNNVKKKVC